LISSRSDAALNMILRAKKISGPEALRLGLVHEVWPLAELKQRAIALAEEIAALPAMAVRSMLEVIVGSESRSLEQMIADERAAVLKVQDSADFHEGIMAFLEKRKPMFNKN
jgi:enoyl-CoA hydratase/carnithine racemase